MTIATTTEVEPLLYTFPAAARRMSISRSGLYRLELAGHIRTDSGGRVTISSHLHDPTALAYARRELVDAVQVDSGQLGYFDWHFSHRFKP